jgi:hypothetical protein
MVAISELNLPEADRAALDASLWAWRAAGIDAALTTWNEVLATIGDREEPAAGPGAAEAASPEGSVTARSEGPVTAAPTVPTDLLPPAGAAVPDPYALGPSPSHPAGVQAVTVIPGLRRIECLVDSSVDYESLWKSLQGLTNAEWTACVLTRLPRMAGAHEELRGTPVQLQGWWQDKHRAVHFTADQAC